MLQPNSALQPHLQVEGTTDDQRARTLLGPDAAMAALMFDAQGQNLC